MTSDGNSGTANVRAAQRTEELGEAIREMDKLAQQGLASIRATAEMCISAMHGALRDPRVVIQAMNDIIAKADDCECRINDHAEGQGFNFVA